MMTGLKPAWLLIGLLCISAVNGMWPFTDDEEEDHHDEEKKDDEHKDDGDEHGHYTKDGKHNPRYDHELLFGGHDGTPALNIEQLQAANNTERMRVVFIAMDRNNDSVISRDELKSWVATSLKALSHEESKAHFETINKGREKKAVTWDDLKKERQEAKDVHLEDGQAPVPLTEEELADEKRAFEAADMDKDGVLNEHEFFHYSHPEESKTMRALLIDVRRKKADKDNNGKIEYAEYLEWKNKTKDVHQQKMNQTEWEEDVDHKFKEYDEDHNGALDGEELSASLAPNADESAEEEVDHLLKYADEDNSGDLDFDEMRDKLDLFGPDKPHPDEEEEEIEHEEL